MLKPARSQDDSVAAFKKQKQFIDSIIDHYSVIAVSKEPLIGIDSIMGKYKGYVYLNNNNNKIVKIELTSDSIQLKTMLYCEADRIIKIQENNDVFYCINDCYYLNSIKQTSPSVVKRLALYKQTLTACIAIFSQ
ncbi:MAG: hypothetical protein QM802_15145 [Agriterribacter sp.]